MSKKTKGILGLIAIATTYVAIIALMYAILVFA